MYESHFLGFLLVHQKIDYLALIAEFALRVGYLCIDIHKISNLFRNFCPYGQLGFCSRDGLAELHIQLNGIAASL